MVELVIDWDPLAYSHSALQIIDSYTTNLINIQIDEYDLAEYAYYDELGKYVSENIVSNQSGKTR